LDCPIRENCLLFGLLKGLFGTGGLSGLSRPVRYDSENLRPGEGPEHGIRR